MSEQIACEPYREREAESKRGPIGEPAERQTQTRDGREDDWCVGENLREDEAEQDRMDLGIVEEAALLVPVSEREQTSDGEPGIPVQETDSAVAKNSMLAQSTPCDIATQEPGSEKQKREPTKSSPNFWERKFNASRNQQQRYRRKEPDAGGAIGSKGTCQFESFAGDDENKASDPPRDYGW